MAIGRNGHAPTIPPRDAFVVKLLMEGRATNITPTSELGRMLASSCRNGGIEHALKDLSPAEKDAVVRQLAAVDTSKRPPLDLDAAKAHVSAVLERTKDDPGAPFEPLALEALAFVREADAAEWVRTHSALKRLGVGVRELKKALDSLTPSEDEEGGDRAGLVPKLADEICLTNYFAQDTGGKLYRFSGGVYTPDGASFVRERVKALLRKWERETEWTSHLAEETIEYVRVDSPHLWERPPRDAVNVKNGILNLVTRELRPHDPDFLSPVQLNATFDPTATCPEVEKFVGQVFEQDTPNLLYELAAWLMAPDSAVQKSVLFLGEGGNGKSVALDVIVTFLGKSNASRLSLHKLETDRFALARLVGKLANVCADLPSSDLEGTSVFKQITGGDGVTAEYKFKDSFDFTPFCRLVFSANRPPKSSDESEGFFERWVVVPFLRKFRGKENEVARDVLMARLTSESERSGLLNKALDALTQFRARHGFEVTPSMAAAYEKFRAETTPFRVWLDASVVDDPSGFVVKEFLRSEYRDYAQRRSLEVLSDKGFTAAMEKARPDLKGAQRVVAGQTRWVWLGIRWLGGGSL